MRMKLLLWMLTMHLIMIILASSETAPDSSRTDDSSRRIRKASIDFWLQPLDKYFEKSIEN